MDQAIVDRVLSMAEKAAGLGRQIEAAAAQMAGDAAHAADSAGRAAAHAEKTGMASEVTYLLMVFVLAIFVGYYVVWRVTPALHSPLLSVTNAVSSVIIVGALIAAGPYGFGASKILGFLAVVLASVNIFGGFIVTQRMLHMYKKKKR